MNKGLVYKSQREWRRTIINRLKAQLGNYCQGCEGPDASQLTERPFLELVIPDRKADDLKRFGNNTISIYSQILKGNIPRDRIRLFCDECKFNFRQENNAKEA